MASKSRSPRVGLFSAALVVCAFVTVVGLIAQGQFARDYVEGETAYENGDLITAEQKFLDSLKSADAPKSRGSRVRLVSQQYGYFPEYYLAVIYSDQKRHSDVLKYAALAKKYIKGGDPLYLTLLNAENQAKNALANPNADERPITVTSGNASADASSVGAMFALVIGIDHYDDAAFPTLMTAVSDARTVSTLLREKYGFETALLVDATRRQNSNASSSPTTTSSRGSWEWPCRANNLSRSERADDSHPVVFCRKLGNELACCRLGSWGNLPR